MHKLYISETWYILKAASVGFPRTINTLQWDIDNGVCKVKIEPKRHSNTPNLAIVRLWPTVGVCQGRRAASRTQRESCSYRERSPIRNSALQWRTTATFHPWSSRQWTRINYSNFLFLPSYDLLLGPLIAQVQLESWGQRIQLKQCITAQSSGDRRWRTDLEAQMENIQHTTFAALHV